MTNEEAKEIIKGFRRLVYTDDLEGMEKSDKDKQAINIAIKALEKAEKYRWHDLRKDPKDLPEELTIVNVTWVNHEPASYYAGIKDKPFLASAIYSHEKWWWWSCVCEDYLLGYGKSPWDEMDGAIEVIAWKYIEEFEG